MHAFLSKNSVSSTATRWYRPALQAEYARTRVRVLEKPETENHRAILSDADALDFVPVRLVENAPHGEIWDGENDQPPPKKRRRVEENRVSTENVVDGKTTRLRAYHIRMRVV